MTDIEKARKIARVLIENIELEDILNDWINSKTQELDNTESSYTINLMYDQYVITPELSNKIKENK